ncbi:MAG: HAMP domain-containing histidine kinase [Oscillospiraceae bacterium]|nr:HAMP domain-containing histidine kinase [Oscillospiraceae bacterium]
MKSTLQAKLRMRFVLLAVLSLLLVLSVIVGLSIYHNYRDMEEKSDMLISQLQNNPSGGSRYFSVKIPAGRDAVYPDAVQHVTVTAEEAASYAAQALAQDQDRGFIDGYRYRIYRNESGTKIYFLYRESAIEMCRTAAKNMIVVSVIGLLLIGVVLIPVSGWIVKPLVDNHNKQKQFITAAGHALKTPLTVISTNAQLLETEIGENEWLNGIRKQTAYLTEMTQELVTLSKAEEYENPLVRENFSFSETLQDILEFYEVLGKEKGISLQTQLQEGISYSGSKAEIQHLLQILLDNACKYCTAEGHITIDARQNHNGVKLTVINTAENLGEDCDILLQRFYRGKNAEGKTGFGIGLAIAEAIANRHNGHLKASVTPAGEFCVEVTLR